MARSLWRAFPWDGTAAPDERFSSEYLPAQSGLGRFDLPDSRSDSVVYFSETAAHAIAEKIQDLRNRSLSEDLLYERGHPLALCRVDASDALEIVDLCDPGVLAARGIAPDRLASGDRAVTQGIAARIHDDADVAGFRWWSALSGDWHTVVFFQGRCSDDALAFRDPTPVDRTLPPLREAARALGLTVA